jgi:cell division protein FtsL
MKGSTFPLLLLLACVAAGVGSVYAKHESRRLFMQLQALDVERDQQLAEWSRLQLEESTWADTALVDQAARERLGLAVPARDSIVYVQP